MKKTIAFILMVSFALVTAFAMGATDDGVYAGVSNKGYRPQSSDFSDGLNYSLFRNPADLATARLRIQGLSFGDASYNFAKAVQNKSVAESVANLTKFKFGDTKNWVNYILGLTLAAGSGYNDINRVSLGTGAQINNYGFGINFDATVKSMPYITKNEKGEDVIDLSKRSILGNGYLPLADYALSFGYGFRIIDRSDLTLDVGAAIHFAGKVYMKQINYDTLKGVLNKTTGFDNLAARGGFAIPLDFGITFGMFEEKMKVSVTVNNVNGYYYMKNYKNLDSAALYRDGTDSYVVLTPMSLNSSVMYSPNFKNFNPTVYFELVDMNIYFMDELEQESPFKELVKYMNLGAKFDIYSIVSLKAAYKYGYPEVGLSVGYKGNSFELVYGFREGGSEYGFKPVDCLSVRVKLGFEK